MSRAAEALADPDIKAEWERETAATLKQLGFPVVEGPTSLMHLLPKASTCLTRRLAALGEFLQELEKAEKAEKGDDKSKKADKGGAESILSKTFGCYSPLTIAFCLLSLVCFCCKLQQHRSSCLRTLTKMRSVYSTMDANSDTLSALQTEGLMTGFYEMLICMFRAPVRLRTRSHKLQDQSRKPRIEGKVKVEMENARRVYLIRTT